MTTGEKVKFWPVEDNDTWGRRFVFRPGHHWGTVPESNHRQARNCTESAEFDEPTWLMDEINQISK